MTETMHKFGPILGDLLERLKAGWSWPAPEAGFARYVFEQTGRQCPVGRDDQWPVADRLDRAPALATTGYVLAGRQSVIRPEWQKAWASGFERLSEREPFPPDRMSFAYRPIYVLGIALGAANCPLVTDAGKDWLRSVLRRLRRDNPADPWADLLHAVAGQATGIAGQEQVYLHLDAAAPEVLALLRWVATAHPASGVRVVGNLHELDAIFVRRCASGLLSAQDVARVAVVYNGLREIADRDPNAPERVTTGGHPVVDVRGLPAGSPLQVVLVQGDHHMGDKISIGGDNIGGAVGRGASVVAQNISVVRETASRSAHMEPDLREKLAEACQAVEQLKLSDGDREDVAENLRKLALELDKPEKNPGMVTRFWNRVNEVAPTVASILSSAASLTKIVGAYHGHY